MRMAVARRCGRADLAKLGEVLLHVVGVGRRNHRVDSLHPFGSDLPNLGHDVADVDEPLGHCEADHGPLGVFVGNIGEGESPECRGLLVEPLGRLEAADCVADAGCLGGVHQLVTPAESIASARPNHDSRIASPTGPLRR